VLPVDKGALLYMEQQAHLKTVFSIRTIVDIPKENTALNWRSILPVIEKENI
jgi:hypothetical protein